MLNFGINALFELELGRTDDEQLFVEEFVNAIRKWPANDDFMLANRALVIAYALD